MTLKADIGYLTGKKPFLSTNLQTCMFKFTIIFLKIQCTAGNPDFNPPFLFTPVILFLWISIY
jgi:hypothetical protein